MEEKIKIIEQPQKDLISKKLAARDLYNRTKNLKDTQLTGIIGLFLTALLYTSNNLIGSLIVIIFVGYLGFMLMKTTKEMKRLQDTYKL